jgi:hypothetical protein
MTKDLRQYYEAMLVEKREVLRALKAGEIRTSRGSLLSNDTTAESIALFERQIAEIEQAAERLKAREADPT